MRKVQFSKATCPSSLGGIQGQHIRYQRSILNYELFSGLICANEFAEVFPDLKANILIPSSIFYVSRQVH